MKYRKIAALLVVGVVSLGVARGDTPNGLQRGQRPGPYSAVVVTGPERGQPFCYICETADRPAVIIFARAMSEPLGRLVQKIDQAVMDYKKDELRAWVTFLFNDQSAQDGKIIQWSQKHALRNVPIGVFEDVGGPPAYRLDRESEVYVLLSVKQKVEASFVFKTGELTDEKIADVLRALPKVVSERR